MTRFGQHLIFSSSLFLPLLDRPAEHLLVHLVAEQEGLDVIEREEVDLAILDVKLPGISGIDALKRIRERRPGEPQLPVLMISGHATVKEAVEAVQLGAADFFEKPIERDRVVISIRNSLEKWRLVREVTQLRARVEPQLEMIGSSEAMKRLFEEIRKVAPTKGRVLITGESGTGKELVARALHDQSRRRDGPFVALNCAALPATLLESELFGHVKGSFTGAGASRTGLLQQATGGSLFLDEVGEMPIEMQAKLLRALQERKVRPVGGGEEFAETLPGFPVGILPIAITAEDRKGMGSSAIGDHFMRDMGFFQVLGKESHLAVTSKAVGINEIITYTMKLHYFFCFFKYASIKADKSPSKTS